MDTRILTTFRRIVTSGGFSSAASELGYAQSTVSVHIQTLEETLGGPVFDRAGRKPVLTHLGKELLGLSEEMLRLEERVKSLASGSSEPSGELNVATGESVMVSRLGEPLARFKQRYPHVVLRMRNSYCPAMIDWVLRGESDLAVLIMPPLNAPDLETRPLRREEMVFVAAPGKDRNLLLDALDRGKLDECFIHTEQGCSYRVFIENFFRSKGLVLEKTMELWSMEGIKKCVQSGLGISFVPLMYVRGALADGSLEQLAAPPLEESFVIQAAWRKTGALSPAAREFLAILEEDALPWR